MKSIAILLYPDVLMLDVAGPMDVFSIANRYLDDANKYRITTIGTVRNARAANGISLQADLTLDEVNEAFDLFLVPGGPDAYNNDHAELTPWLNSKIAQCKRFGSICTGAFILARAGLLNGHRVTTHWNYTERLAKCCPDATIETNQIYINDRKLITSGGITAGIDMALAIVADDHGKQVALEVAKVLLVVMKRQGGQAQFSPLVAEIAKENTVISKVQRYVLDHIEEEYCVERMASMAAMSPRHFSRTFVREANMTPMEFVHSARIDSARSMLESSDLPLKTIAYQSGFGSSRHMRVLFCEKLGLTPHQYRQQFN